MNCDRTEQISLLIDGELEPADAQSVEQHLNKCADCRQVHADFLTVRSRIAEYQSIVDPAATRGALARVLSSRAAGTPNRRATQGTSRWRIPGLFGPLGFKPAFVTAVALLMTGAIAFVLYRAQQESNPRASVPTVVENSAPNTVPANSPSPSQVDDGASVSTGSEELNAGNRRRKVRKVRSRESETTKGKPTSPLRPTRERGTPKPLPQVRSAAPPTFARLNESVMPTGDQAALALGPESGNLRHLEQSQLLLRAFRNIRLDKEGGSPEVSHERRRAQKLVYQNMLLRREADAAGNIEVATLLASLEPILLDIAHLSRKPRNEEVKVIRERVERQSLVPLLQVSSLAVLRSND